MKYNYKSFVGPQGDYDLVGSMQFNLLTALGLRDYHKILDIGCGSLRSGKLFIPFLQAGNYFGIEPNEWLIKEGIKNELGKSIIKIKNPKFDLNESFELDIFNESYDFILAQSIFSHAGIKSINKVLSQMDSILSDNGFFLATFVIGISDYQGEEWIYPECVRYKESTVKKLIKLNGLKTIALNWKHPSEQIWFLIFKPTNKIYARQKVNKLHNYNEESIIRIKSKYLFNMFKGKIYKYMNK